MAPFFREYKVSVQNTKDNCLSRIRGVGMEINNNNLKAFRKDFDNAVRSLQDKYGVTISLGGITYEDERFSAKMTVINGIDPEQVARNQFDAEVWRYEHLGLQKGMYNRIFLAEDGKRYAVQGFNPKARKWPITAKSVSDGEPRICNERFTKKILNEYYVESFVSSE